MVFGSGQSSILGGYSGIAALLSPPTAVLPVFLKKPTDLGTGAGPGLVGTRFPVHETAQSGAA